MINIPTFNEFRLVFPINIKTEDNKQVLNATELTDIQLYMYRDRDTQLYTLTPIANPQTGNIEANIPPITLPSQYWSFGLRASYHGRRIQCNWHHAIFTVKDSTARAFQDADDPYILDGQALILSHISEQAQQEIANLRTQNEDLTAQITSLQSAIQHLMGDSATNSLMRLCVMDYNPNPDWLTINNSFIQHAYMPEYLLLASGGAFYIDTPTTGSYDIYFLVETKDIANPYPITKLKPFKISGGKASVVMPAQLNTKAQLQTEDNDYVAMVKIAVKTGGHLMVQVTDPCHLYAIIIFPKF